MPTAAKSPRAWTSSRRRRRSLGLDRFTGISLGNRWMWKSPAQEFLSAHFKDLTVAYAVEEQKYTGKEYEVVYTDRTEIEFRSDGQWESVGRKYSPVPASIVPQPIQTFVSGSNYPGQFIRQIDRNAYTWEVELSNGLEIKFDNQFNVIDIDD